MIGHETSPVPQPQETAFAAHCFGDQERLGIRVVQAGGVELDELHVLDPAAGAPGHGDAVARGGIGVGRVKVDLARATGGDHGVRRRERHDAILVQIQDVSSPAAVVVQTELGSGHEVNDDVPLEHRDVGMAAHLVGQGLLDGRTGRVGDMDDATVAVAALARQVVARLAARERHALRDQPFDRLAPPLDHEAGGQGIAKSGAGGEGVLDMGCNRIGIVEHRRDTTLRPRRRRVIDGAFGHQGNAMRVGQP